MSACRMLGERPSRYIRIRMPGDSDRRLWCKLLAPCRERSGCEWDKEPTNRVLPTVPSVQTRRSSVLMCGLLAEGTARTPAMRGQALSSLPAEADGNLSASPELARSRSDHFSLRPCDCACASYRLLGCRHRS